MSVITQHQLKQILDYEEDSGIFKWKIPSRNTKPGQVAGTLHSDGGIIITIDKKGYYAHRLAWLFVHGYMPISLIDHVNSIRSDNRLCNLRPANRSENMQNQKIAHINKSKGMLLGTKLRANGKWFAVITINHKRIENGPFDTEEEAHKRYISLKRLHHPHGVI